MGLWPISCLVNMFKLLATDVLTNDCPVLFSWVCLFLKNKKSAILLNIIMFSCVDMIIHSFSLNIA